jgi:hypothetical protein
VKPLRVVHAISSPAAGGAEVYVKDLATELAREGHRPSILFLSRSADIGRSSAFEEEFLRHLDAIAIPYAFLGHECRRNPLLGMLRTRRFVHLQRADIYHSHLKYSLLFGAGLGRPHVHTSTPTITSSAMHPAGCGRFSTAWSMPGSEYPTGAPSSFEPSPDSQWRPSETPSIRGVSGPSRRVSDAPVERAWCAASLSERRASRRTSAC